MKDCEIDTTDGPPVLDWGKAVVGKFYRPGKTAHGAVESVAGKSHRLETDCGQPLAPSKLPVT